MKWINVNEGLPDKEATIPSCSVNVLITDGDIIDIGYYMYNRSGCIKGDIDYAITHWMPLPELP